MKTPIHIILSAILLTGCNKYLEEVSLTATNTLAPNKEIIATITSTQAETPHPTSIRQSTFSAFENLLKNVCPTTTPNPAQDTITIKISDNEILREFAGKYSKSSGFWVFDLVLNCDGSFYEITLTDTGDVFIDQGNVEVQESKIIFKITNRSEHQAIIMIPLRWGQRKYLIYNRDSFCEAMISDYGKEPRNEESIIGLFYLRIGDNKIDVTGLPVLPNGEEICR